MLRIDRSRPRRPLPLGLLAACLLSVLLTACQSSPRHPPNWVSGEVAVPSERILWEVTVLALEQHGYPVGTKLDPVTLEAVTGWSNHAAPFRGKGYRERAHVKYARTEDGDYGVDVRVEREVNMDLVRPLDLSYAEWEPAPDNQEQAQILLQRIRAYVGGNFEMTPDEPLPWEGDEGRKS